MSDAHQADRDRSAARAGLRDLGRGRGRLDPDVCRGCQAQILWTTARGRRMPLDPKPVTAVDSDGELHTVRVSHLDTCPMPVRARAPRQPDLPLTAPLKMWPPGTDPWAIIDEELGPAYDDEPTLRPLLRAELLEGDPVPLDLDTPAERARLARLRVYRVFGIPALIVTREQQSPPLAWVRRNPALLGAVERRIER